MSCSTTCQTCGSWYLPRFLFRGVIDSHVHGLLDGPDNALGLPIHYQNVIQLDGMACSLGMVKDGEVGTEMLLIPVPKTPTSFPYVFHCTFWVVTPVPVDDTSFVKNAVPVLEATNKFLTVFLPLKWTWTSTFPHIFVKLSLSPFEYGTTMKMSLFLFVSLWGLGLLLQCQILSL